MGHPSAEDPILNYPLAIRAWWKWRYAVKCFDGSAGYSVCPLSGMFGKSPFFQWFLSR